MQCKLHPKYKAKLAPRSTTKHPHGCGTCWILYRASKESHRRDCTAEFCAIGCRANPDNYTVGPGDGITVPKRHRDELSKKLQECDSLQKKIVKSGHCAYCFNQKEVLDNFTEMWNNQRDFMHLLQQKRNFPSFPVDITSKTGQKLVKDIAHDAMHELFEAIHLLKNSKDHRKTEVKGFDRENFIEECVDAFKFFLEILVLLNVTPSEFKDHFDRKGLINEDRINGNY